MIEFDEAQHFNPHRATTIDHYPAVLRVAFDTDVWRERSRQATRLRGGGWGKPKPPLFPDEGGRHLQRAFRDMLADVLPPLYGWELTVRIAHFEVEEWLREPDAAERMAALLRAKTGPALDELGRHPHYD